MYPCYFAKKLGREVRTNMVRQQNKCHKIVSALDLGASHNFTCKSMPKLQEHVSTSQRPFHRLVVTISSSFPPPEPSHARALINFRVSPVQACLSRSQIFGKLPLQTLTCKSVDFSTSQPPLSKPSCHNSTSFRKCSPPKTATCNIIVNFPNFPLQKFLSPCQEVSRWKSNASALFCRVSGDFY